VFQEYGPCDVAGNGKDGLAAFIVAHNEHQPYPLVCVDIRMPVMDGHETVRRIRDHEEAIGVCGLERAKVLMISAISEKSKDVFCKLYDCDGYVVKPLLREELASKMALIGFKPLPTSPK